MKLSKAVKLSLEKNIRKERGNMGKGKIADGSNIAATGSYCLFNKRKPNGVTSLGPPKSSVTEYTFFVSS